MGYSRFKTHDIVPMDIPWIQIWQRVSDTGPGSNASWSRSGEVYPWNIKKG